MNTTELKYREYNAIYKEMRLVELSKDEPEVKVDKLLELHEKLTMLGLPDWIRRRNYKRTIFFFSANDTKH